MLGYFPSKHRINPERFLERPRQNLPATRTTYGAPQNTQKTLECAKKKYVSGTSKQLGMRPRCCSRTFAPTQPNSGWVSLVWVHSGCTGDLREWVPEVEVTKRLTFNVIGWVMVTFAK